MPFAASAPCPGRAVSRRRGGGLHGAFYGRWLTAEGGQANRKLARVRRAGSRDGLTRGQALLAHLEAKGSSKAHLETVESHLRVHLVPQFKEKPLDRGQEADVTRLRRPAR
jgi:hypothetical protein